MFDEMHIMEKLMNLLWFAVVCIIVSTDDRLQIKPLSLMDEIIYIPHLLTAGI